MFYFSSSDIANNGENFHDKHQKDYCQAHIIIQIFMP